MSKQDLLLACWRWVQILSFVVLILIALVLLWQGFAEHSQQSNESSISTAIVALLFAFLFSTLVFKPKGIFAWMNKSYSVFPRLRLFLKPLLWLAIVVAFALYGKDSYLGIASNLGRLQVNLNSASNYISQFISSFDTGPTKYEAVVKYISIQPYLNKTPEYIDANSLYSSSTVRTDSRGFINVWQLRRELAVVEALITVNNSDACIFERDGYSEEKAPPSAEELERVRQKVHKEQEASRSCIAKMEERSEEYMSAAASFNNAWLPLLIGATQKGDFVAEVIIRQCQTTPVLDRSQIESVCDENPERKSIATKRLREIGFSPAYDWESEFAEKAKPAPLGEEVGPKRILDLQAIAIAGLGQGVYGLDSNELMPFSKIARSQEQLETFQNTILIRLARKFVQRAFTLPGYPKLGLNRRPLISSELTWGPMLLEKAKHLAHAGNSYPFKTRISDEDEVETKKAVKIDPNQPKNDNLVAGLDASIFEKRLGEVLASTESTVNHYLKQDSRWAIFLINRIGHHEYVPVGINTETHHLDPKLAGQWLLEKTYEDWQVLPESPKGSLNIGVDSEYMRATTKNEGSLHPPLADVKNCTLRYSGGESYLWSREGVQGNSGGKTYTSYTSSTPFGNISGFHVLRAVYEGMPHKLAAVDMNVFVSLDTTKRYQQILMQCQGGEEPGTDRVRFIMLIDDDLIEVATETSSRQPVYIRHYHRAGTPKKLPIVTPPVPPPTIDSFTTTRNRIAAGTSITLTPLFRNGIGHISPDVGEVTSGKPVIVNPTKTTIYTLSVSGRGAPITRHISIATTNDLTTARSNHSAILLPNGKVLIVGGLDINVQTLDSAELYDPATGTFTSTGSLITARGGHAAIPMSDGKVLQIGGWGQGTIPELYDTANGTFKSTGKKGSVIDSTGFTATMLQSGEALIAGGISSDAHQHPIVHATLFNSTTGKFKTTGSLTAARFSHTATLLMDGKVLLVGGYEKSIRNVNEPLSSTELYIPSARKFKSTGILATARVHHTATLLQNGKVLIAGGEDYSGYLSSVEIYNPDTGKFITTGDLNTVRSNHTATLLKNGKVLIVGGISDALSVTTYINSEGEKVRSSTLGTRSIILNSAELYDPETGGFTATGSLAAKRIYHTATLLPNGKVLIIGGGEQEEAIASAEIYNPDTGKFNDPDSDVSE